MDLDIRAYLILAGVLLVPAVIVFIALTVVRVRRTRFHRQKSRKRD